MSNRIITYDHYPAILASEDEVHYSAGQIPSIGDTLTFEGHTVNIISVHFEAFTTRPIRVKVSGDKETIAKIRELLTFRVNE